jgi:hypothetical protein
VATLSDPIGNQPGQARLPNPETPYQLGQPYLESSQSKIKNSTLISSWSGRRVTEPDTLVLQIKYFLDNFTVDSPVS